MMALFFGEVRQAGRQVADRAVARGAADGHSGEESEEQRCIVGGTASLNPFD